MAIPEGDSLPTKRPIMENRGAVSGQGRSEPSPCLLDQNVWSKAEGRSSIPNQGWVRLSLNSNTHPGDKELKQGVFKAGVKGSQKEGEHIPEQV